MTRVILITGASSGLGEGMAREFAARATTWRFVRAVRRTFEALKSELESKHSGISVSVRTLDVNDHEAVFQVLMPSGTNSGSWTGWL